MYVRVRTKGGSIGGGPIFWLIAGPLILAGYALVGAFMLAMMLVGLIVTACGGGKKAPAVTTLRTVHRFDGPRSGNRALPATQSEPEDAVPPGYTPRRPRT